MSKAGSQNRGNVETILLKQQLNDQMARLFDQLEDLEELKVYIYIYI